MSLIRVENVNKDFRINKREKGVASAFKTLIKREYSVKNAVSNLSFRINEGEIVGYIGSNGAGKSTTIKMLSGILVPTSGEVMVDGLVPYKNRKVNAKKIGVVFGQRTQLYWNLPIEETFDLYRKIFKVEPSQFKKNVDFFVELLEMQPFLRTPVRQLSLGQRMRAELVVSLLHDPKILYLDEPTIGLDIMVKQKIRKFIRELNEEKNTTIILTTHDMDDIDQICNRVIAIEKGQKIFDGSIDKFKNNYSQGHKLSINFKNKHSDVRDSRLTILENKDNKVTILFRKEEISVTECISILSNIGEIEDIKITEPNMEKAFENLYTIRTSN
ncbi:ATP-binding cassette domain-containing protein [Paraliobacillus sp. X-1268]|uniref:ABC transporter ATP-binding protein n=1 Tax=Paraliobacillus sp. X-1268 TaxID=2213193 RepID=UPI000E3B733E|nr:ATP-binding cassette domain-containing protein [Paraliobacillus sp. X-1268]